MAQLVLTEQQSQLIRNAKETVVICDPAGHVLGHAQPSLPLEQLDPVDRQAVENFLRRRKQPREKGYSSEHVRAMLQALQQEWQRTGGFDQAYMEKFIASFRTEDAR